MATKFVPDYQGIGDVMRTDEVRNALHQVAAQIAPQARAIAEGEHLDVFADAITVEDGTRPKGRSFSRVTADDPDAEAHEFGDTNTQRRRVLGRAAGVAVNTR